jgi:hypothetical protein
MLKLCYDCFDDHDPLGEEARLAVYGETCDVDKRLVTFPADVDQPAWTMGLPRDAYSDFRQPRLSIHWSKNWRAEIPPRMPVP